ALLSSQSPGSSSTVIMSSSSSSYDPSSTYPFVQLLTRSIARSGLTMLSKTFAMATALFRRSEMLAEIGNLLKLISKCSFVDCHGRWLRSLILEN
ncbi:hypothetical protein KI809_12340, partial [Geobacter pelophilus]